MTRLETNIWKVLKTCQGRVPTRYVPLPSQYFETLFLQKIKEPYFSCFQVQISYDTIAKDTCRDHSILINFIMTNSSFGKDNYTDL
jgi:hypothetical protein